MALLRVAALGVLFSAAAAAQSVELVHRPSDEDARRFYQDGKDASFEVRNGEVTKGLWQPYDCPPESLHRALALALPGHKARVGKAVAVRWLFENVPKCQKFTVGGTIKLVKVEKGIAHIEDRAKIDGILPIRRKTVTRTIRRFTLEYTARYSIAEGAIVHVTYKVGLTVRELTGKREEKAYPEREGTLVYRSWEDRYPLEPVKPKEVDAAVAAARGYLEKAQRDDGSWPSKAGGGLKPGASALALTALLHTGTAPGDPRVTRALAHLRKQAIEYTYFAGPLCMALRALCSARGPSKPGEHVCRLTAAERALMKRAVTYLLEADQDGSWGYFPPPANPRKGERKHYDHSNTQYAVLGLRAAGRCGVKVGPGTWRGVLKHFVDEQQVDPYTTPPKGRAAPRGWPYHHLPGKKDANTMTMTCVGGACLLVSSEQLRMARKLTKAEQKAAEAGVRDAVSWIEREYRTVVRRKADKDDVNGYMLFGLERVGVLAARKTFRGRDWYQQGARLFIRARAEDGSIAGRYGKLEATVFSLLFLRRATAPLIVITEKPGEK